MRNIILVVLAGTSACAARANYPTTPVEYACGDAVVVRDASGLREGWAEPTARMAWRDDSGEHYVAWPATPTGVEATEYIVPADPRQDAVRHTYDTTNGSSTQDWRLIHRQVCTARGGYNDALAQYIKGVPIEDIARDLQLDHDEARAVVARGLMSLQKKYWHDR